MTSITKKGDATSMVIQCHDPGVMSVIFTFLETVPKRGLTAVFLHRRLMLDLETLFEHLSRSTSIAPVLEV